MDEFAQSREDDDLFADDFEPVAEPTITIEPTPKPAPEPISSPTRPPATEGPSTSSPTTYNQPYPRRDQGQEKRQRGRGRGGGGGGLNSSRYAQHESKPAPAPIEPIKTPPPASSSETAPTPTTPASATAPPTEPVNTRTPAVRGDRSATGGPLHKKLTEEELTAKLAQMAIINAQKAERHRLSEADQAAFQHREKELAKERKEKAIAEKKNERVMEMERAKNRERKMKAQQGREWDSEKVESDIVDRRQPRTSEYVRGGHGGVINQGRGGGLKGSRYASEENGDTESAPARGRGGGAIEIRGRGRGGGRGGRGGKSQNQNSVPTPEDFPELPKATKELFPEKVAKPAANGKDVTPLEALKSPISDKPAGDWAEEMATPIESPLMETEKKEVVPT